MLTWYYKGQIGAGFTYWPEGPQAQAKQLFAPMWGRAAVVENEVMYPGANACEPENMRKPEGLAIDSMIEAGLNSDGWQIKTGDKVIQYLPANELRLLFHWGADIYMDLNEMTVALDHSDDLTHEQVFDIFLSDLKSRGISCKTPTDPLHDQEFIQFTSKLESGAPTDEICARVGVEL